MTYTRKNQGVCSAHTTVCLSADNIIESVSVEDGCDGNLKGVCALLAGMPAAQAIPRLRDIRCGGKATSCPHQIALCLQEAMAQSTAPAAGDQSA